MYRRAGRRDQATHDVPDVADKRSDEIAHEGADARADEIADDEFSHDVSHSSHEFADVVADEVSHASYFGSHDVSDGVSVFLPHGVAHAADVHADDFPHVISGTTDVGSDDRDADVVSYDVSDSTDEFTVVFTIVLDRNCRNVRWCGRFRVRIRSQILFRRSMRIVRLFYGASVG